MFRLEGPSEIIREATPPLLREAFALLTRLGDVAFLVVLLSVLYWLVDRETAATVIAYALVGLTVTFALKEAFALPRPPAPVRTVPVDSGSYGFPSGHALSSTVVYGGLLLARERIRDLKVAVPVAVLVILVGLSRVVIGVHYLGDILAGFAIGVALLGTLWVAIGRRADLAALVAATLAVPFIALTGGGTDSLFALGSGLGATIAFRVVDPEVLPFPSGTVQSVVLVTLGLVTVGGLYWVATTVTLVPVVVVASALFVATVVVFPASLHWSPIYDLPSRG